MLFEKSWLEVRMERRTLPLPVSGSPGTGVVMDDVHHPVTAGRSNNKRTRVLAVVVNLSVKKDPFAGEGKNI